MRNQSQEIYDHIEANPGACTQDIVEGTGWNRHLVEVATDLMILKGLIAKVGETDWRDPQFEVIPKLPEGTRE